MRATFLLFSLLLLAAWPAAAKPPLDYSDPPADPPASGILNPVGPGQQHGSLPERLDGVGPFQHLPAIDESPTVLVSIKNDPNWRNATFDPVLTNACRLGDFASVPLNPMMVRFTVPGRNETLGQGAVQIIPPDRRHLLVDLRRLAAPGETYYFEDAAYPSCRVWVENLVRPRHLSSTGTSLPASAPGALRRREAEIKSWPKQTQPEVTPSGAQSRATGLPHRVTSVSSPPSARRT